MRGVAEWFIRSDDGQPHMAGWMNTAIKCESTGQRDTGWKSLAVCPRCSALVLSGEFGPDNPYGDRRDPHERWHAATDHPVPADLAERARR